MFSYSEFISDQLVFLIKISRKESDDNIYKEYNVSDYVGDLQPGGLHIIEGYIHWGDKASEDQRAYHEQIPYYLPWVIWIYYFTYIFVFLVLTQSFHFSHFLIFFFFFIIFNQLVIFIVSIFFFILISLIIIFNTILHFLITFYFLFMFLILLFFI